MNRKISVSRDSRLGFAMLCLTFCISGCALTPDQATQLTPIDLCDRYFFPQGAVGRNDQPLVHNEIQRRRVNCDDFRDAVLARENSRRAANAALFQGLIGASAILNATTPPPTAPIIQSAPTHCRVVRNPYGDQIYCN